MIGRNRYSFFKLLILCTILLIAAAAVWLGDSTCGPGQFYSRYNDDNEFCLPCPEGSFMPHENHQITSCSSCTKAEPEHVRRNCTSTSDTVLGCDEGFYWKKTGDVTLDTGDCYKCTVCTLEETNKFEAKPCSENEDTICCPEPGMLVVGKLTAFGQYKCIHPGEKSKETESIKEPDGSILRFGGCKQNEFMIGYNTGNTAVFCKPCEKGSYVDKDDHMMAYCEPCTVEDMVIRVGCQDQIRAKEESNIAKKEENVVNYEPKMTPNTKKPHDREVNSSAGLDISYVMLIVVAICLLVAILVFIKTYTHCGRQFARRLNTTLRRPCRPARNY